MTNDDSQAYDEPPARKGHPVVRLGRFIAYKFAHRKDASRAKAAAEAEDPHKQKEKRRFKKHAPWIVRLFSKRARDEARDDSDSDEDFDEQRGLEEDGDFWDGNVSEGSDASEMFDPNAPDEDDDEQDYIDAFRPGGYDHPCQVKEPLPRLGPEDIRELEETMHRMNPKYHKAENMILEEKLERAVSDRLARLKKAGKFNAILAFGSVKHTAPNAGVVKIPTLISVSGHRGTGGNIGINGVYERYPDNYHGRPVFQKYLERQQWETVPQEVEFHNGAKAFALDDLDNEKGGRTFPTINDSPGTRLAMQRTMMNVKVLAAPKMKGSVGDFRFVDRSESWFIFFNDLLGAWCIGPTPGSQAVFARCFGVDQAIPDNLGPDRWEVFDIGHRKWYTHPHLKTMKGGLISSATC